VGVPQAQHAPLAGQRPEPQQLSLPGQLPRAICLARGGDIDILAGCARRDGEGERGQELRGFVAGFCCGSSGQFGLPCRVIRVRRERRDLIGAPDPQRHRGEDFLELGAIVGGEQA
jgi:hypothetical protein